MGQGFSKMKKQARLMQEQFQSLQNQMEETLIEGSAGKGLVKILLNGKKEVKKIVLQPECVDPQDIEGLQDLLIGAFEDASKKLESSLPQQSLPWSF